MAPISPGSPRLGWLYKKSGPSEPVGPPRTPWSPTPLRSSEPWVPIVPIRTHGSTKSSMYVTKITIWAVLKFGPF